MIDDDEVGEAVRITSLDGLKIGQPVWVFESWCTGVEEGVVAVLGRKHLHVHVLTLHGVKKVVCRVETKYGPLAFASLHEARKEQLARLLRRVGHQEDLLSRVICERDKLCRDIWELRHQIERGA